MLDGGGKETKFCNYHFHMWLEKQGELSDEKAMTSEMYLVFLPKPKYNL